MKIGNIIFQRILNKHSFHIPNWNWLRKIVRRLFKIRVTRGRGKRRIWAKKLGMRCGYFDASLPLKYSTRLHIYLPYMEEKNEN